MGFGKRRGENRRAEMWGHWGRELWGKRPGWYKELTHRLERREAAREIEEQLR